MEYKVLITTSGIGSRLGNLTKYSNKALIRVGDYAILTHIIKMIAEKFGEEFYLGFCK